MTDVDATVERIRSAFRVLDHRATTDRKFNKLFKRALESDDVTEFREECRKLAKTGSTVPLWLSLALACVIEVREIEKSCGVLASRIGEEGCNVSRLLETADRHLLRVTGALGERHTRQTPNKGKINPAHTRTAKLRKQAPISMEAYVKDCARRGERATKKGFFDAHQEFDRPNIRNSRKLDDRFDELVDRFC